MENISQDPFYASYRAFMTALFVGVADALLCLVYNVCYRSTRPYFSSSVINVSYIIFGMLLIFTLIGLVYLFALRLFRNGSVIFSILMAVVTLLLILSLRSAGLSDDPIEAHSLRTEAISLVAIVGVSAVVFIPVLHGSAGFERNVI